MDPILFVQPAPFTVDMDDIVDGMEAFDFANRDFTDCEDLVDAGTSDDANLSSSTSDIHEIAPRPEAYRNFPTTKVAWSTLPQQAFHPSVLFPYAFRKGAVDAELHFTHWGFRVLGNGLATRHLSLISTSSRTPLGFANVCSIHQAAGDQSLVAAHDIDGIILLKNMRLDDLNLESGNTSTALDQDPHAHSGLGARQDKYSRLASGVTKMPALLSSDGAGKGTQAATRLIGTLPVSDVRVRKGLKSLRNTSCVVPWEVKRLTVDRNLVLDAWHVGGVLGCGTYGTVFHVYNKLSGTELAMKVLDIQNPLPGVVCDGLLTELLVLEKLAHCEHQLPYLLQPTLKRSWAWQTSDGFLHMLTELCPGGELRRYAGQLNGAALRLIIAQLVVGVESLHDLGIVHHDLKPENVLIDKDGHCVIADYGSAKLLAPDGTVHLDINENILATLPYAAPELLSPDDCDDDGVKYYDESVDWWALGSLIMYLVMGKEYFNGSSMAELLYDMPWLVEGIPETLEEYGCSDQLIDLVCGLLTIDPSARLREPGIRDHPYFSRTNWTSVEERKVTSPFLPSKEVSTFRRGSDYNHIEYPDFAGEDGFDFIADLEFNGLELQVDDSLCVPSSLNQKSHKA